MGYNQGIWNRYSGWTDRSRNVVSVPHITHSGSRQNKTSVLPARGHQILFPLLRCGLPHERRNVWAYLELPTGGLKCAENSNHMRREAYYYCATVQYYSTVVKNWPTSDFNFWSIKSFQWTVLTYCGPMTLPSLEPGGRGRAHPDKLYMGRAAGVCEMEKISYKMGFFSPRPLKFFFCAFLGHPRVV